MRSIRHRFLSIFAGITLAGMCLCSSAIGQTLQIDELKANYLKDFLKFVQWNENSDTNSFVIGIIGSEALVTRLQNISAKQKDRSFPTVIHIDSHEEVHQTDLLFVSSGHESDWAKLSMLAREHNILLVGEDEGFCDAGGIIEFIVRKNRLRFSIDLENAEACGIRISSKLIDISIKDE